MADERDPKLTQRYRELEAIEPPAELDRKILDLARHAALAAPKRRRWYYPLAAAAVLVFAVAITLHVERERPDVEMSPTAAVRGEIKPAPPAETKPREEPPRMRGEQAGREQAAAEARVLADQAKATSAPTQAAGSPRLAPAPAGAQVAAAPENPDRWLERIAELRSRGRHAEADRELAAFRKAYPKYPLSDVMRERVEGTPAPAAQ